MILKGNGFVKEGTTGWSTNLLTDANLGFRGRTVFAPAGTWDFSAVGAGEKVKVVGAGNFSGAESNAVYVSSLLGLTPATAATYLDSARNVYYNPDFSPSLGPDKNIVLTTGGHLIALPGTPRGTMVTIQ